MADLKAKNSMGAREIFNNRLKYKSYAWKPRRADHQPENALMNLFPAGTVDFWWAERAFYGKVSTNGISEPIEPFSSYLKGIKTKKSNVFALNFVADAFKEFQTAYLLALKTGEGYLDDPVLAELLAVKGYVSAAAQYKKAQQSTLDSFLKYLSSNNLINEIVDMEDFLSELLYYITNNPTVPFTRSGFIMSRHCSPLSSGLCIEVKDLPYSEDEKKNEFIKNQNFPLYRRMANEYGFSIDKNIPWRLVASVSNPKMQTMAQKYQSDVNSAEEIVEKFYVQTAADELESMKLYIMKMYNQFVKDNPRSVKISHSNSRTAFTAKMRSLVTLKKLNSSYSDCKWCELYIKIRNMETGLNYPEPAEKAIIRVAKDIQKTLDTDRAMSYIKIKFSGVEFYEGSLSHQMEKSRQITSGEENMSADEIIKDKARGTRKVFF